MEEEKRKKERKKGKNYFKKCPTNEVKRAEPGFLIFFLLSSDLATTILGPFQQVLALVCLQKLTSEDLSNELLAKKKGQNTPRSDQATTGQASD